MKRSWSQTTEYGQLGIIESVNLRNFMCYDNLHFEMDPHINFVIGLNGSGKSAIMCAIILALGGKATTTGRYSNLKRFIKIGKKSATISVTLKNCGPEAYKPEEFGEKIIVERVFSLDGPCNYKLKSEAGRIVSTSKEELLNILSVMDIQIDNPIALLTQDTSKHSLASVKPDKLFQLFYKGTGLARVHESYKRASQSKMDAKLELHNKKAVLIEMEKDVKKLKFLLDKPTELKRELLWAQVIDFEKQKDESQEAFDKVNQDVENLERKLNVHKIELNDVAQTVARSNINKRALSDKMDAIRKEFAELDKERAVLASSVREIEGKCSRHERQVQRFASEVVSLEKIMDEIRLKNENDLNADKLRHEMTVNNLKNQILSENNHLKMTLSEKNCLYETYVKTTEKQDACHAELTEIKDENKRLVQEKEQLTQGKKNRINVFGREMENVLLDIKSAVRARKFRVEPKGPIGLYINVKQPEWNFAVQECLKSRLLKSFLCDNYSDSDVLNSIFNKHYRKDRPSIITSKFVSEVYDVSPHKTVCEHPTVLDMLNIEDPIIANCLIDQAQIENILLIADPNQALNLMLYKPPNKCRFAYTPNGDQYCPSPFRNYSCRNMNQICMLKTVNKDDIRKKDRELKQLHKIFVDKVYDERTLLRQLKQLELEMNNKDSEITQLKIKINQMEVKLQEEEHNVEEPKDINCLHSDLVQVQKQKQHHEECLADCRQDLNSKTAELNALTSNIEELKRNLQEESQKHQTLTEKVEELLSRKENLETLVSKYRRRLKEILPRFTECEKELSNCITTVEMATRSALDIGPRIDTNRSPDTIKQIVKETERFIKKQKNCDRQALLTEYEEKLRNLEKAKQELNRQERITERLDSMMQKRYKEFQKICKNTSVMLTCTFGAFLKQNNYSGYPDVKFDQHTLEIHANPNTRAENKNSSPSLLSGGERSYVTIALLLSLWERTRMPFRILDEYDVFMDSTNRHLSVNMLINEIKKNTKLQYIFLSPQELPQIESPENVKVHKMPAPRK